MSSYISVGQFVHAAADTVYINEETLDGLITTHATSTVLYQRNLNRNFAARVTETKTTDRCKKTSAETKCESNGNRGI